MIDALKVLFILTGSTYLVTKYSKVDNQTSSINRVKSKNTLMMEDNYTVHDELIDMSSIEDRIETDNTLINNNYTTMNGRKKLQNDLYPYVRPLYVITIEEEDIKIPKLLLQVAAPSASMLRNKPLSVRYSILSPEHDYVLIARTFSINSTSGELFLVRQLNRDPPNGVSKWKFSINAHNDDRTQEPIAFADVVINVKDINDNLPIFTQSMYIGNITENLPSGTVIIQVTAIDNDDSNSANGRITYHIHYNDSDNYLMKVKPLFAIDTHSGVITSMTTFDREINEEYLLTVSAIDGGGLVGSAHVTINVIDVNDCVPRFRTKNWTIEINEIEDVLFKQNPNALMNADDSVVREETIRENGIKNKSVEHLNDDEEEVIVINAEDDDLPESNHLWFEIMNCTYTCFNGDRTKQLSSGVSSVFSIRSQSDGSGAVMVNRTAIVPFIERHINVQLLIFTLMISVTDDGPKMSGERKDYTYLRIIFYPQNISDVIKTKGNDYNHCSHIQCYNGAKCHNVNQGFGFRCECANGFSGILCDDSSDNHANHLKIIAFINDNLKFFGPLVVLLNIVLILSVIILRKRQKQSIANRAKPSKDRTQTLEVNINRDDTQDADDADEEYDVRRYKINDDDHSNSIRCCEELMLTVPFGMVPDDDRNGRCENECYLMVDTENANLHVPCHHHHQQQTVTITGPSELNGNCHLIDANRGRKSPPDVLYGVTEVPSIILNSYYLYGDSFDNNKKHVFLESAADESSVTTSSVSSSFIGNYYGQFTDGVSKVLPFNDNGNNTIEEQIPSAHHTQEPIIFHHFTK